MLSVSLVAAILASAIPPSEPPSPLSPPAPPPPPPPPAASLSRNALILIVGGSILVCICILGLPFAYKECRLPSSDEIKVTPQPGAADDSSDDDDDDDSSSSDDTTGTGRDDAKGAAGAAAGGSALDAGPAEDEAPDFRPAERDEDSIQQQGGTVHLHEQPLAAEAAAHEPNQKLPPLATVPIAPPIDLPQPSARSLGVLGKTRAQVDRG